MTGQPGETVYRVTDIFTTRDGSWEPSDAPGSVPQWARDAYLKPWGHPQYFDDAGAAQNLFGGIAMNGNMIPHGTMHYYTYTDNQNHTNQRAKIHGWANIPIYGHSDVPGPWAWYPKNHNAADVVKGGGMPHGWHVSWFVVWEVVALPNTVTPPIIDPPVVPLTLEQRVARLERLWEESQAGK